MSNEVQHDQLPSIEEVKTSASINAPTKSMFWWKFLSASLLLMTIALSVAVGILSNRNIFIGTQRMEGVIRKSVVEKGIVTSTSEYQFQSRSPQKRALDMVMKESNLPKELVLQHYALWCFYFSTEHVLTKVTNDVYGVGTVPHWKDSWLNDGVDPCLWNGVRCKSGGIVVELNLASSQITGMIPKELKLLDSLTKLDISDNPGLGEGGIPVWFKEMDSLDFLDLRECTFSGDMPNDLCDSTAFLYADCEGTNFRCSCCNLC